MNRFQLGTFAALLNGFHQAQWTCGELKQIHNAQFDLTWFAKICEDAAKYCHTAGFEHSSRQAFLFLVRLQNDTNLRLLDASAIQAEFRCLEESIIVDLTNHKFVQINQTLARYFDAPALYGDSVAKACPSSATDIQDAGNCIALGLGTAAVFHLMRVVEWGLRALCRDLKVSEVKKGPIEYATWEAILEKMPEAVDVKIKAMSRGPRKQKAQEFYHPALKEINGFKDAWRNHVMHVRREYTAKDAEALSSHVERFMKLLADYGVREAARRKP